MLRQICWVVVHLHTHDPPIVHGSLKDSAIAVECCEPYPKAKLLEFGFAQMRTYSQARTRGDNHWRYRAPELWQAGPRPAPRPAIDIFALGGLMFLLASDKKPFSGIAHDEVFFSVRKGQPVQPKWEEQRLAEGEWRELPKACMRHSPNDRPDCREVLARVGSM